MLKWSKAGLLWALTFLGLLPTITTAIEVTFADSKAPIVTSSTEV